MARTTGFQVNLETMDIRMNRGDTGSFKITSARDSGTAWTEDDRMLLTVRNAAGEIVMQRIYRLDDQYDLGDGVVLVEFHNNDTDTWNNGSYEVELRFDVSPIWSNGVPAGRCVDALTANTKMIEGPVVRTVIHSSLTIEDVYGDI